MKGQDKSDFFEFLKAEYTNIAEAHFKTIESISTFFKHYLAIVSIPITVIVLFFNIGNSQGTFVDSILSLSWLFALVFLIIAMVGLFVLCYIINLRMDALLYARTINAIRKYFYDEANLDIAHKICMRVLPQSRYIPPYRERYYFWPVVCSFGLLDGLCALFGWSLLLISTNLMSAGDLNLKILCDWRVFAPSFLFFCMHLLLYCFLAHHRELGYLSSYIIGVDIDGVLNNHREHFCSLLRKHTRKKVAPDQITAIPVHECEGLGVTREDEKKVFNDPKYWIDMPAREHASDVLRRLRNSLSIKVFIFTHRPWPITVSLTNEEADKIKSDWKSEWQSFYKRVRGNKPWWTRLLLWVKSLHKDEPLRVMRPKLWFQKYIDRITKLWLEQHGFEYDKIMIEKASEDVADPQAHIRNRFFVSRTKQIRFFVEDDLIKAKKLAFICDIVFLIDHPYNQDVSGMPANVIRVKSWEDILKAMRRLS